METNGESPSLADVRALLERDGKRPVLLYIPAREKGPRFEGWQNITCEQTQALKYQRSLATHPNTGVLLGVDNLCTIDCDTEAFMRAILELVPQLEHTLCTRGARGCQFWAYITGSRPTKVYPLKVKADSPLAVGGKPPDKNGLVQVGEFRAEGGQSVIRGIHESGCLYRWLCAEVPIAIDFADIVWPDELILPWEPKARETRYTFRPGGGGTSGQGSSVTDLLERAKERLSIDFLWEHFRFHERRGNPTHSPFREDKNPSFSIYDDDRHFKDHGTGDQGDSFDFYQRAMRQDSRQAFTGFIELAGLGAELRKKPQNQRSRDTGNDWQEPAADAPIYEEVDLEHFVDEDREPVPEFPLDTLSDTFRKPVEEVMRHYRVSALLPAICALVINSVGLGRGVVTKSNVRRTYGNLYAIIGAQSGSGKSPVFDEFMAPLMEIQKASFEEFNAGQKPRAEAELKILCNEIQKLAKQGKDFHKFDTSEDCRHEKLAELLQQKAGLEDKLQFSSRLWTEDFTSEALGVLLASNKEQVAVLTDDGGLVIYNLLGRYTDGDVKDDILLCKAKTVSPVPIDRVGRGAILLHQPCVAMLVLTQPDLLYRLFGNERLLVGGFLARCLAVDSRMEIQDETEESLPEPDSAIMSAWNAHIQSLVKMFRFSEESYLIAVAPEVRKLSRQYFNIWAEKARGTLSDVSSFAIRWCERAWEISLNLHTGLYGDECFQPISTITFENAIRISDFFAERQLEVLRRPRIEVQGKQRSRLEELLLNNNKKAMTIRALRDRHGLKKEEVFSTVKSHSDIFGIVTFDPPHGGSKSTLVFLRSDPPSGMRFKK